MKDTRVVTEYLKGFAVLVVYANHFVNEFVSDSMFGYASGFIAVFFIFSGYGIYLSLDKHRTQKNARFWLQFFKKRLIRLYPLLWLWSLIYVLVYHKFNILAFFALDFVDSDPPWFVSAIMMCYLAAPILFLVLRNLSIKKGLLIVVIGLFVANVVLFSLDVLFERSLGFRGLFFTHIFLFCLGIFLAKMKLEKSFPMHIILICILVFLFFVQEGSGQPLIHFTGKTPLFSFLFPFSALLLCYVLMSGNITLPLKPYLVLIGRYAYSVYLFHIFGFVVFEKTGLLQIYNNSWENILVAILISIPFILVYIFIEIAVNEYLFGEREYKNILKAIKEPFQKNVEFRKVVEA
jgi:peptidoglycan/LPS O-acetylase OafA/YrhL